MEVSLRGTATTSPRTTERFARATAGHKRGQTRGIVILGGDESNFRTEYKELRARREAGAASAPAGRGGQGVERSICPCEDAAQDNANKFHGTCITAARRSSIHQRRSFHPRRRLSERHPRHEVPNRRRRSVTNRSNRGTTRRSRPHENGHCSHPTHLPRRQ